MTQNVFYAAKRVPLSVFMQTMLRSQVGTFVGPNGLRFYRCAITQVNIEKQTIHGLWRGLPVGYDISNWHPNVKVCPGSILHTPIEEESLEEFMMRLNGRMYPIYIPSTVKRGDELLFDEMRCIPNGCVTEVRLQ